MERKKYIGYFTHGICILALGLIVGACQSASPSVSPSNQNPNPAPETAMPAVETPRSTAQTPQPTQAQLEASPGATGDGGLTYEEMRRTTPPAPLDLRISSQNDGVHLDWSTPPPVTIPHVYSDVIIHYNIYRRTSNEAVLKLIDTSESLSYVDTSAVSGKEYYYAVSAVHEGPLEGERTDEVSVTVP